MVSNAANKSKSTSMTMTGCPLRAECNSAHIQGMYQQSDWTGRRTSLQMSSHYTKNDNDCRDYNLTRMSLGSHFGMGYISLGFTGDDCNLVLTSTSVARSKAFNSHSDGAFPMEASTLLTFGVRMERFQDIYLKKRIASVLNESHWRSGVSSSV